MIDLGQRRAAAVVLRAVAADPELGPLLVLKGALAAEAITRRVRSTRDVDLSARSRFCSPDDAGRDRIRVLFTVALRRYCDASDEGWHLFSLSAEKRPRGSRAGRFGWDGFRVKATLQFRSRAHHVVEVDVSFGDFRGGVIHLECLGDVLRVAEHGTIAAYSAEEQIAEKLRAFLQKLPAHTRKIGRGDGELPRVRDLGDIHALIGAAGDTLDWQFIADAFREKCRGRLVDCTGVTDFAPEPHFVAWYRSLYLDEHPGDPIDFDTAWTTVLAAVREVCARGGAPGILPLPLEPGADA